MDGRRVDRLRMTPLAPPGGAESPAQDPVAEEARG